MTVWEIFMIGVGLSMDAAAVCMTNSMTHRGTKRSTVLAQALFFGAFQALMPLLGYFACGFFTEFITKYSGIVVLLILGVIGGKMIFDGCRGGKEEQSGGALTYKILFFQAIATSIDAFAVGVGFSAMQVHILPAVLTIGVTTAVCSLAAIWLGKKFGVLLGHKDEILGGCILVFIGIKALF